MKKRRISPMEFLVQVVLPALFDRLDDVFPEFGWEKTTRGWVATNKSFIKEHFGAKSRQVEAHSPTGFMIDGKRFLSWPAYLNKGSVPEGKQFIQIVHRLAFLVGMDASSIEGKPTAEEEVQRRRVNLLETFMAQSQAAIWTQAGKAARAYLMDERGFSKVQLKDPFFGLYTTAKKVQAGLLDAGFATEEVVASGLLADQRWENRLVFPWRGGWGRIQTIAARDLIGTAQAQTKFLYLAGGDKPPAFGLHRALRSGEGQWDLVLVQGLIDVVYFHCHAFANVAAIGGDGTLLTVQRWEALIDYGVRCVTLALDSDKQGRDGLVVALENLRQVDRSLSVFVLDPNDLGPHHDPGQVVRQGRTIDKLRRLLDRRKPAAVYFGLKFLEGITPTSPDHHRRVAVEKIMAYAATLGGPAAELDREDLINVVWQATGYSRYALRNRFREHDECRQ